MSKGIRKLFWKVFSLDVWLLIGLLTVTGYGLIVLYSASGGSEKMFTNRIVQVTLGLGLMFFYGYDSPTVLSESCALFIPSVYCDAYFSGCDGRN